MMRRSRGSALRLAAWTLAATAAISGPGCGKPDRSPGDVPVFDGDRAFSQLNRQVDMGFRVPGTPAHRWTMEYLAETLRQYADSVDVIPFQANAVDTSISMWNLIGHFKGTQDETVLLGAHWDSRPWADKDPDPTLRHTPIPGANDGASGVAVLLELARLMGETRPPRNVDIVFFDAEDLGEITNLPWCMGSSFYARSLRGKKPDYAIVVDMIGDSDLEICVETHSEKFAYAVVQKVWKAARELKIPQFIGETRHTMYDDHMPLIEAGIPAIVIIDFDYPYWHTVADTPDKCSPRSLEAVGRVLVRVLYGQ